MQEFELQIGEDSAIPDRPDEFAGATVAPAPPLRSRIGPALSFHSWQICTTAQGDTRSYVARKMLHI